ncbi:hypothetical protein LINGRAHAP2_LOCUS23728, partial [Linum grandiflorum]
PRLIRVLREPFFLSASSFPSLFDYIHSHKSPVRFEFHPPPSSSSSSSSSSIPSFFPLCLTSSILNPPSLQFSLLFSISMQSILLSLNNELFKLASWIEFEVGKEIEGIRPGS